MTTVKGFGQDRQPLEMHGPGTSGKRRGGRTQAKLAGQHSAFREIGVGTNDPAKATHILRETAGAGVLVERIETSTGAGSFQGRKARGTEDARTAVVSGDDLLSFEGIAYVGATNGYQPAARIVYEVDGSVSDAAVGAPARMTFLVSSGSGGSLGEKMRITSAGKVGIGMNDPSTKLTVEGAVTLKEQAAADADVAAYGQLWVKTATPNELYFTTDAGNDIQITSGTSMAGGGAGGGSGDITGVTIQTDTGSGSKASDTSGSADFTLQGGEGVDVTNSGAVITVAGEDASTSNKGVASFHSDNFSVSSGAVTIKDQGVAYAEIQNVSATDRILGRDSSGAGVIEEITPANLRTMLNVADGATAGGEANESSFKTISVSGQDNVVADADDDTLTLAAGSNVTITTTAASDTITFASADTNTQLTQEQVEDFAGALVASGGTKTGISVTYQDGTGDMDFAVSDLTVTGDSGSTGMTPGDTLTIAGGTACATAMSGDTLTINATDTNTQLSTEQVQDIVGAMFSSNTETRCTVTYQDGDGTIDVAVDDMTADTQLTTEAVQDIVGAMFTSNTETRITATYEDGDGTIDLVVTDMTADTQLTTEAVQDIVGAMLTGNTETRIAVTYEDGDGTIDFVVDDMSGGGEANESSFKTISVSGQDDVVADADDDTLTLVGGTNVTITTTAGTDTITFASADTNTMGSGFVLEDGDGTEVTITENKEVKFVEGTGIDIDWTDVSPGSDADPYDLTFTVNLEGTELVSTGETGGSKFLREDGDGTCSWQTVGGGGGSGDVEAGSTFTTAGVIMACDGDDKTIDEPNALLTTNGQGMTVSAALATPFQVDSSTRDGNSTFKFTTGSGSGTNNQASLQVIAQTAANANLNLGDTASPTKGGLKYKNSGDSMQLIAAGNAVLELDSAKVVEFKIAEDDDSSGSDYTYAMKALKIKVNGTDYWLQLYEEGGGMGGP